MVIIFVGRGEVCVGSNVTSLFLLTQDSVNLGNLPCVFRVLRCYI